MQVFQPLGGNIRDQVMIDQSSPPRFSISEKNQERYLTRFKQLSYSWAITHTEVGGEKKLSTSPRWREAVAHREVQLEAHSANCSLAQLIELTALTTCKG